MHKINKIQIAGFRRLRDIDIEMRPLMVLVGPNGVGKTSLLDAVTLLSASAAGELNKTLNRFGGMADVTTRGGQGLLTLEAEMNCPDHNPLVYNLQLEIQGQGYKIRYETLTQQREENGGPFKHIASSYDHISYFDTDDKHLGPPDWEHNTQETSLSQVPKMFKQPEELRRTLSAVTMYHVLDVSPRAPVKLPQQMKPALLPGEDGEDLIPFLYNLRESNHDRYESIEDILHAAYPGFDKLSFPSPAAGMLSLTWKESYFKDPVYANQLSEGTLRFLWLVSLLSSPNLSTVTMIDEPEVSLHPELLSILADVMREASQRTQIVVATHSDRLVRFLKPHEVLVMDVDDDGFATARWADDMDLDRWLDDYSLDEVWRMGRMGGRP